MQTEPSACFTRRVRLLLIIITGYRRRPYSPIRQCSEWSAVLETIFDFCQSKTRTI